MQQMYDTPQKERYEYLPVKDGGKTIYAVYKVLIDGTTTEPDYYENMTLANRYCEYKNQQLITVEE